MRRASLILAAVILACATALALVVPASAAPAPRIVVQRVDPLMTSTVGLEVAVIDTAGTPVPFTGTAALRVGTTAVSAPLTGTSDVPAVAQLATSRLSAGMATLVVQVRAGGRAVTSTLRWFAEIPASFELAGFSCTAIPPGGGAVRWMVSRLQGDPVRTPNSRDVPLLPYVPSSAARWSMTTEAGLPMITSGTLVIRSGTRVVATQTLPATVRKLVFGTTWTGRVGGAFRPGVYTATITLRDAAGRSSTATQRVTVIARGTLPCGP